MVAQLLQNQIEKIEYKEKKYIWILFSVFVLFVVSYGYLINCTFSYGVSKQNMEKQITLLNSSVNSLEYEYLGLKNNITLDFAKSKGYISVITDKYAIIDSSSKNVSLSINEN